MTISKERLEKIEAIRDQEIDYSDIPETDETFWATAQVRMPQLKKGVYLRLDQDFLDWIKGQGPGYQTRINAILRSYMRAHKLFCQDTWTSENPIGDSEFRGRLPRVTDDKGNEYWLLISGKACGPLGVSSPFNRCPVKRLSASIVTQLSSCHDKMDKDNSKRIYHDEAKELASSQTRHEWCRLMHLARDTKGLPAVSVLMGLMVEPGKSPNIAAACASPSPGPIDVTVTVDRIKVLDDHNSLAAPGDLNYTLHQRSSQIRAVTG